MEENSQQPESSQQLATNEITENTDDINQIQGESYGDNHQLQSKSTNLRISFLNINSLPSFNLHEKNETLRNAINEHNIDILGIGPRVRFFTFDTYGHYRFFKFVFTVISSIFLAVQISLSIILNYSMFDLYCFCYVFMFVV